MTRYYCILGDECMCDFDEMSTCIHSRRVKEKEGEDEGSDEMGCCESSACC